jgi:hypothetical protein
MKGRESNEGLPEEYLAHIHKFIAKNSSFEGLKIIKYLVTPLSRDLLHHHVYEANPTYSITISTRKTSSKDTLIKYSKNNVSLTVCDENDVSFIVKLLQAVIYATVTCCFEV